MDLTSVHNIEDIKEFIRLTFELNEIEDNSIEEFINPNIPLIKYSKYMMFIKNRSLDLKLKLRKTSLRKFLEDYLEFFCKKLNKSISDYFENDDITEISIEDLLDFYMDGNNEFYFEDGKKVINEEYLPDRRMSKYRKKRKKFNYKRKKINPEDIKPAKDFKKRNFNNNNKFNNKKNNYNKGEKYGSKKKS